MNPLLHVTNRKEWRSWLRENHDSESLVWLVYNKKHTGKPRVAYNDAVEEALCFGWIDSIVRRIDEDRYAQKFTPRKAKSNWSATNKKRVKKLIATGEMTAVGMQKIEDAKRDGSWDKAITSEQSFEMPAELISALDENLPAKSFFTGLAPSYQRQFIGWITTAKRFETRQKRVKETMNLLLNKKKLGMK